MNKAPPSLRQRLGLWLAGAPKPAAPAAGRRSYAAARSSRFNVGLGSGGDSSADSELSQSLSRLRSSSRQVVRDAPYAKRAKAIIVNNVIGAGIGLQAQVKKNDGELFTRLNDDIEAEHCDWSAGENCHTGGTMHMADLERAAMGQVFEAGEVFIRQHYRAFGSSRVPFALELIEPERVADDMMRHGLGLAQGTEYRMGAEVDSFGRPLAWWIRTRHPGDVRMSASTVDKYERVPAADVFHLYIVDRWPQTRGEPWMHTALRKLDSIDQYSAAELQAAQADAYHFATIQTTQDAAGGGALATNLVDQQASVEKPTIAIENGMVQELEPGEEMVYHSPTRPNTAIDPFLRYMLREVAAGLGVSYESLSRDYSQTTYSSGRLAILDDRDLWRVLQQWWIRSFRLPLYRRWLQQAVLGGALPSIDVGQFYLNLAKFQGVKFKPRGWNWVDPTKEVAAYKEAEKAGYISAEDIIAQTANGLDIEDVVEAMKRSAELYEEAGIVRDTDVAANNAAAAAKSAPAPAAAAGDTPDPAEEAGDAADNNQTNGSPARVVSIAR